MAFTITPLAGIDLVNLANTNTNSAGTSIPTIVPVGAKYSVLMVFVMFLHKLALLLLHRPPLVQLTHQHL